MLAAILAIRALRLKAPSRRPTYDEVQSAARVSPNTVSAAFKTLEATGEVVGEKDARGGDRRKEERPRAVEHPQPDVSDDEDEVDSAIYDSKALVSVSVADPAQPPHVGATGAGKSRGRSSGRSLWSPSSQQPKLFRASASRADPLLKSERTEAPATLAQAILHTVEDYQSRHHTSTIEVIAVLTEVANQLREHNEQMLAPARQRLDREG